MNPQLEHRLVALYRLGVVLMNYANLSPKIQKQNSHVVKQFLITFPRGLSLKTGLYL